MVMVAAAGSSAPHPAPEPVVISGLQTASVALLAEAGGLFVTVTSRGDWFEVDPHRLVALARRYVDGVPVQTAGRPLPLRVGRANALPDVGSGGWHEVRFPVSFPSPPPAPGMYSVALKAQSGFARVRGDDDLVQESSDGQPVWWPDEAGDDRGLAVVRARLAGHAYYGYGGTTVGCLPAWYRMYAPQQAIPVRSVERERGRAVYLGTGRSNDGFGFIAIDPIVAMVEMPDTKLANAWGGSGFPADGACPALRFADPWYLELSGSTSPPPRTPGPMHLGMSRSEVRWLKGYPSGFASAAEYDRLDWWIYEHSAPFTEEVDFKDGRVVDFTKPVMR